MFDWLGQIVEGIGSDYLSTSSFSLALVCALVAICLAATVSLFSAVRNPQLGSRQQETVFLGGMIAFVFAIVAGLAFLVSIAAAVRTGITPDIALGLIVMLGMAPLVWALPLIFDR